MYRASYCDMYINQRDAQILANSLYSFVKWLYMFRTIISPSSGATFNKLYSTFVPVRLVAANNSPKNVEPFNEKIKTIRKNMCISLVYIHIAKCKLVYNFLP